MPAQRNKLIIAAGVWRLGQDVSVRTLCARGRCVEGDQNEMIELDSSREKICDDDTITPSGLTLNKLILPY